MNLKVSLRGALTFFIGSFIAGAGVGILNSVPWGNDAIAVFISGMAKTIGIEFSVMNTIVLVVIVVLTFFLDKKQLSIMTFTSPITSYFAIQFTKLIIPNEMGFSMVSGIVYLVALVILAFGIAVMISADSGKAPYDALIFSLITKTKLQYYQIRWITDGLFLATGILLRGKFGFGTIIAILTVGKMVQFWLKVLKKNIGKTPTETGT